MHQRGPRDYPDCDIGCALRSNWVLWHFACGVAHLLAVTLMSYPDLPLKGRVDSLGWGISPDDGTTGYELLPEISATFEWIRLAQRVPVRIHLEDVPDEVKLHRGTTASVVVLTGTAGSEPDGGTPALPRALQ